mmetsp:Transcript_28541/g.76838  ORF Transcript_28541/g.76838 Transcript_28541/m.76838 type:complete len:281 (+) Transcript_28541:546-1388(+)
MGSRPPSVSSCFAVGGVPVIWRSRDFLDDPPLGDPGDPAPVPAFDDGRNPIELPCLVASCDCLSFSSSRFSSSVIGLLNSALYSNASSASGSVGSSWSASVFFSTILRSSNEISLSDTVITMWSDTESGVLSKAAASRFRASAGLSFSFGPPASAAAARVLASDKSVSKACSIHSFHFRRPWSSFGTCPMIISISESEASSCLIVCMQFLNSRADTSPVRRLSPPLNSAVRRFSSCSCCMPPSRFIGDVIAVLSSCACRSISWTSKNFEIISAAHDANFQ